MSRTESSGPREASHSQQRGIISPNGLGLAKRVVAPEVTIREKKKSYSTRKIPLMESDEAQPFRIQSYSHAALDSGASESKQTNVRSLEHTKPAVLSCSGQHFYCYCATSKLRIAFRTRSSVHKRKSNCCTFRPPNEADILPKSIPQLSDSDRSIRLVVVWLYQGPSAHLRAEPLKRCLVGPQPHGIG